jgi:hypothetical protein
VAKPQREVSDEEFSRFKEALAFCQSDIPNKEKPAEPALFRQ